MSFTFTSLDWSREGVTLAGVADGARLRFDLYPDEYRRLRYVVGKHDDREQITVALGRDALPPLVIDREDLRRLRAAISCGRALPGSEASA